MDQLKSPTKITSGNAKGEDLFVGDDSSRAQQGTVIAGDGSGNSLTLLEEYSLRKRKTTGWIEFSIALICATTSLTLAAQLYFQIN